MTKKLTDEEYERVEERARKIISKPLELCEFDPEKAKHYFIKRYEEEGHSIPEFRFFASPIEALAFINEQLGEPETKFHEPSHYGLSEFDWIMWYTLVQEETDLVFPKDVNQQLQDALQMAKSAGWAWTYDTYCVICEHPQKLFFNDQFNLNAVGKKAIEYSDGWGIYCIDGVIIPEEFGAVSPQAWQAANVLTHGNAEVRRALIQAMGYEKIIQDIGGKVLSQFREYELIDCGTFLKEDENYLIIKMTCPSTGHIHAHRVPPTTKSAEEAITWVNHGIHPDKFLVQT